jgi:hypothetical protein
LTHESVWKYDVLYNLMLAHPRFEPALCMSCEFCRENMLDEMEPISHSRTKGFLLLKHIAILKKEYLNIKSIFNLTWYFTPTRMKEFRIIDIT